VSDDWIIAGIVIGVAVVAAVPAGIVFCCRRAARASRRPAHDGIIVAQPAIIGTTVLPTQQQNPVEQGQPMHFQNPQPYPKQPLPLIKLKAQCVSTGDKWSTTRQHIFIKYSIKN
jgi:hypothetical protein